MKKIILIFLVTLLSQTALAEVISRSGAGTLEIIGGIRILRLKGTPYEMGRQHGALLAQEIRKGAIPFFVGSLDRTLARFPLLRDSEWMRSFLQTAIKQTIYRPLEMRLPRHFRETLEGLSKGSGLPMDDLLTAAVIPDAVMLIADTLYGRFLNSEIQTIGCTTFAARGAATATGEMVIGRNFDYAIVDHWDLYPTVIYFEPDRGMKYLAVSSAGIPTAGITGLNEAGLTITLHNHSGKSTTTSGMPIVALTHEVIRQARNMDEAISLLRKLRPASNWSINLSHWPSKRAAVVEISPRRMAVREMKGDWIAQTNFFHDSKLRADELFVSQGIEDNIFTRYERITDLLTTYEGRIDPEMAAIFLGDHIDAMTGQQRGGGRTLATITTIASIVFAPESRRIFVGTGRAPVSNTPYLELPLLWDIRATADMTPRYLDGNPFRHDAAKYEALAHYVRANQILEHDGDVEEAIAHLKEAAALHPQDGHYWITLGIMTLKTGRADEALAFLEKALLTPLALTQQQLIRLYEGRAYDLLGLRRQALAVYKDIPVLGEMDRVLKRALDSALSHPYTETEARGINFQFEFFDLR